MKWPRQRYASVGIPVAIALGVAGVWVTKPPAAVRVTIPAGTVLKIRLGQALASDQSRPGDEFEATLTQPVSIGGAVAVPEGARIIGKVVDARPAGSLKGTARLRLTLNCVVMNGWNYEVHTTDVAEYGSGYQTPHWAAAGGRKRGALGGVPVGVGTSLVGSSAGAGAGAAGAAKPLGRDVRMPATTALEFRLIEPLAVAVQGPLRDRR
ncbi:MAG TPA: hypothetical protein VMW54_13600 [Terriglobia bacterium]|nr:hypothetical protein [Terriglobia bacterium]